MILGVREGSPSSDLAESIRRGEVAGLLWFRSALGETTAEAIERIARARAMWPYPGPLFVIDEEGGLIQQLSGLMDENGRPWPRLPSPRAIGRAKDPRSATAHGREVGRRLRVLGLDATLAPTVDLDPGPESPVLGTRCFGEDPALVAEMAAAWLRGLASAGVRGCVKHYPGHGATRIDSHMSLPRLPRTKDLDAHLSPYRTIARQWDEKDGAAPAVLTAHIRIDGSGSSLPASLDPDQVSRIPPGLGPVFTDSLDMGALQPYGDMVSRGALAAAAGSDWIVVGMDIAGGIALARSLAPDRCRADSPRAARWLRPSPPLPIPEPWPFDDLVSAAEKGLRLLVDRPIPTGEWDWILPADIGAYGPVAEPVAARNGIRWIGRVIRYDSGDPASLAAALAGRALPFLVGWIHRGPPDPAIGEILRGHPPAALAHLLDDPAEAAMPMVWTIGTCGFGEGEIIALERFWSGTPGS